MALATDFRLVRRFDLARLEPVQSARAIRRAAREALGSGFFADWCERAPYRFFHEAFRVALRKLGEWPRPDQYGELAELVPTSARRPRFVMQEREALERTGGYEQHVAQERAVPTRPACWHDFFNMAMWAHFPHVRWALNALHVDAGSGPADPRNGRTPLQNVAAQLDESGAIVASSSPELLDELARLRFKRVFWERRAELERTTRIFIVGHGTLESLLTPHPGLASKAVLVPLVGDPGDLDELRGALDLHVAEVIRRWRVGSDQLHPLPLVGIPGWADNERAEIYDDPRYFRFERRARTSAAKAL
jgi:hypothetical protein